VACLDEMNTSFCQGCSAARIQEIRMIRERMQKESANSCAPHMGFMPAVRSTEKKTEVKTEVYVETKAAAKEPDAIYIKPRMLSDLQKGKENGKVQSG
jgi:hypothetical protein